MKTSGGWFNHSFKIGQDAIGTKPSGSGQDRLLLATNF